MTTSIPVQSTQEHAPARRTVVDLPTPRQVVLLQSVRTYPCVSLLMNTTPAAVMLEADALRLRALAREAEQRLRAEAMPRQDVPLVDELWRLVDDASRRSTAASVGVFTSVATSAVHVLPVAVQERVVVDPTFATRDLVRAVHRTPRHVVLALSSNEARLFDGVAGTLRPAVASAFPIAHAVELRRDSHRAASRDASLTTFLRRVDRALGTYLRLHPAPLIVAGPERVVAQFVEQSRNVGRLAGVLTGAFVSTPLAVLAERIRPELEAYLRSRQTEALELLDRRVGQHRAVSGIAAAWLAARWERTEMLAIEEGYFFPARISDNGDYLQAATDVEHPDVIDDAVDELIELVLHRGGWIALVPDGALAGHDRVALTLRSS